MPRFGSFEFDAEQRELRRDGQAVHLTPKAFDLLGILLGAAPRVVSKDELHRRMWAASCVSDAALVGLIKEVRRALDDRDRDSPMIRTVHRVGYAFCRATTERPARVSVSLWIVVGGQRVALHEGANSIGRDPSSTVWIDVASVSRRHAQIVCDGQRVSVQDLGSKNGTTVGGQVVAGVRELCDGDKLAFGRVEALFCSSKSALADGRLKRCGSQRRSDENSRLLKSTLGTRPVR